MAAAHCGNGAGMEGWAPAQASSAQWRACSQTPRAAPLYGPKACVFWLHCKGPTAHIHPSPPSAVHRKPGQGWFVCLRWPCHPIAGTLDALLWSRGHMRKISVVTELARGRRGSLLTTCHLWEHTWAKCLPTLKPKSGGSEHELLRKSSSLTQLQSLPVCLSLPAWQRAHSPAHSTQSMHSTVRNWGFQKEATAMSTRCH